MLQINKETANIWKYKLLIYGNTKFAIIPIMPVLYVHEKPDYNTSDARQLVKLQCNFLGI